MIKALANLHRDLPSNILRLPPLSPLPTLASFLLYSPTRGEKKEAKKDQT